MIKVGLTGGIGSGKSTASTFLKELGFKIIDADLISREVLGKYEDILKNIREEFSDEVFYDGKLNRKKLGEIVFKDKEKRINLENIILPYIIKEIKNKFYYYEKLKEKIVFLDAPTLIENGLHRKMDYNILIYVEKKLQIQRVKLRDKLSDEEIINRINAQMSLDDKKAQVDFIIDNSGEKSQCKKQILKVIEKLRGHYEI